MDDLVQFLRDRLADDERTARAATWDEQSDVWTVRPPRASYERYTIADYCDDGVVAVTPENADADGVGQHIARHDPARVLREVEAKQRLLGDHLIERETYPRPMSGDKEVGGPYFPFGCATCHAEPDTGEVHGFGYCLTWKALALPYADHPDYRDAWRP